MNRSTKLDIAYKSIVIITLVLIALIYAGNLIMPILFSGMVTVILLPFSTFLEKKGLGRGLSSFVTVLLISIFLIGLIFVILIQSQEILKDIPRLFEEKENFLSIENLGIKSQTVYSFIENHSDAIEENLDTFKDGLVNILRNSLIGVKDILTFLILCPIYIFFMLLCRDNIYNFISAYHKKKSDDEDDDIIDDVKESLYHYLKGLFVIMSIAGTLTFIGLYIIGIEYAFFLGVLTAILTPIPYIGVIISASIPIILALLTKDSMWYVAGVLIVFSIVQFLEAYLFTPKIMGNNVNVNPLMIILGLFVLGSLAGILGMILTVPFLAITKVIIDYYPHLKPWKYLLEDKKSST